MWCCNNNIQSYLVIHSLAATYNKPATAITKAHKLFQNQLSTLFVAEKSHDTIDPITPGNAAAAFPAKSASSWPRLRSWFYPIFNTTLRWWFGGVEPLMVPLGISASTITPIIIPMAVNTLTNDMPCPLNNALNLSRRVVSSFKA